MSLIVLEKEGPYLSIESTLYRQSLDGTGKEEPEEWTNMISGGRLPKAQIVSPWWRKRMSVGYLVLGGNLEMDEF